MYVVTKLARFRTGRESISRKSLMTWYTTLLGILSSGMTLFGIGCDIAREANVESTKSLFDAPLRWLTSLVLLLENIVKRVGSDFQ